MNLYLVQYADNNTQAQVWAEADSHLDAAASVLIDRGFGSMLHKQDDTLITVVCRDSSIAGNYPKRDVREYADRTLGLTTLPDNPTTEADWWKG
jgi:hypothetical protein